MIRLVKLSAVPMTVRGPDGTTFKEIGENASDYGSPSHKGSPNLPPGMRPDFDPEESFQNYADDVGGKPPSGSSSGWRSASRNAKDYSGFFGGLKKMKDDIAELGYKTLTQRGDDIAKVFKHASENVSRETKIAKASDGRDKVNLEIETTEQGAEQLEEVIERLKYLGDIGASRSFEIANPSGKEEKGRQFSWDGDGSAKIHSAKKGDEKIALRELRKSADENAFKPNQKTDSNAQLQLDTDFEDPFQMGVYSKKSDEDNLGVATVTGTGTAAAVGGASGAASQAVTGKPFSKSVYETFKDGPSNVGSNAKKVVNEVDDYMRHQSGISDAAKEVSKGLTPGKKMNDALIDAGRKVNWSKVAPNALSGLAGGAALAIGADAIQNASSYGMGHLLANKEEGKEEKEGSNSKIEKCAGGPGSGISYDNTSKIDYDKWGVEKSPSVSLHNRKDIKDSSNPERVESFSLDNIDYVAQEKIVIPKLGWFLEHPNEWDNDPIDVLKKDGEYHLMDGHHRFEAAMRLGKSSLPGNIYFHQSEKESKKACRSIRSNQYLNLQKYAAERGKKKSTRAYKDVAQTGGVLMAGSTILPNIPSEATEKAKEFERRTLNAKSPSGFASAYINKGSDLMGSDVLSVMGRRSSAKNTIRKLRTSDLVERVFGDTGGYDKRHYEAFESGPREALKVIGRETAFGKGGKENIPKPNRRIFGIETSRLNPFDSTTPHESRDFNRQTRKVHAREGLPQYLDNKLQEVAGQEGLDLKNRGDAEKAVRKTLQKDDPVINNFNRKVKDYWGDAPNKYKENLFDRARKYKRFRKSMGRTGLALGAIGALGYGASTLY